MVDYFGVLNIDKPSGCTSYDIVHKLKKTLKIKKIGHGGTLDPMATGVLPILLGKATRLMDFVTVDRKTYLAEALLGIVTNTQDADGDVLYQEKIPETITKETIQSVLSKWRGTVMQTVPVYSAVKQEGRRLYELARRNQAPKKLPRREVTIHKLELLKWESPTLQIKVECGKGTYIRQLASDIGSGLGCGAHLTSLRRTQVGILKSKDAVSLEVVEKAKSTGSVDELIIPPRLILSTLPAAEVSEEEIQRLLKGQHLDLETMAHSPSVVPESDKPFALYTKNNDLIAITKVIGTKVLPKKVFHK